MTHETLDLPTTDGPCRTGFHAPEGKGPWPGVVFFFDAGGPRASMSAMAARLAALGYVVALPDLYHRVGSVMSLLPPGTPQTMAAFHSIFNDPALRAKWMSTFYASALDYAHLRTDVTAVLDQFAKRGDVHGGIGTVGYCMGGNASVRTATVLGDRIAATAAIHAGGLVTPAPDSPHTRVGQIRSTVYVAGASEDASFSDEAKAQLDAALTAAEVDHTIETYPARHGFAVPDGATYDAAAAERHWAALEKLFASTLRAR